MSRGRAAPWCHSSQRCAAPRGTYHVESQQAQRGWCRGGTASPRRRNAAAAPRPPGHTGRKTQKGRGLGSDRATPSAGRRPGQKAGQEMRQYGAGAARAGHGTRHGVAAGTDESITKGNGLHLGAKPQGTVGVLSYFLKKRDACWRSRAQPRNAKRVGSVFSSRDTDARARKRGKEGEGEKGRRKGQRVSLSFLPLPSETTAPALGSPCGPLPIAALKGVSFQKRHALRSAPGSPARGCPAPRSSPC